MNIETEFNVGNGVWAIEFHTPNWVVRSDELSVVGIQVNVDFQSSPYHYYDLGTDRIFRVADYSAANVFGAEWLAQAECDKRNAEAEKG